MHASSLTPFSDNDSRLDNLDEDENGLKHLQTAFIEALRYDKLLHGTRC